MTAKTTRSAGVRVSRIAKTIQDEIVEHLYYSLGTNVHSASRHDYYAAVALTVRRMLVEGRRLTSDAHVDANPKYVYYFSAEYLLGKQLAQNLLYTGATDVIAEALGGLGIHLDEILAIDPEPGLGNGGLGRLAACYLDSLATLDMPAVGYGLRYEFGIFKQEFADGWQIERPDAWSLMEYHWEFPGPDDMIEVGFGGTTRDEVGADGRRRVRWVPASRVLGEPYTHLVPGFNTNSVNILRLWRARASQAFDFALFNTGDYARAVEQKVVSENLTKVLYPNDDTFQGRRLRLMQQYFFVACSIRDILRRFRVRRNEDLSALPDKAVIHLNDTHPVVAIPELMRILLDEEDFEWDAAWDVTRRTFAYTCHTLMPEALETWPVSLLEDTLPRHLEIVYEINRRFLDGVTTRFPGDTSRVARMSLIDEHNGRRLRMAHLATVGSFAVNGVAPLHSELLRTGAFRDFAELWPERFQNRTNGVTPRRFLRLANPGLAHLITSAIGPGWLTDLERLSALEPCAEDAAFRSEWMRVKRGNKETLARLAAGRGAGTIDPGTMYDVMVKRLHEYKRQLLKLLHVVALSLRLKEGSANDLVPRTMIFGAKAAPGYAAAKHIIKLINDVSRAIASDPVVSRTLRVCFIPNYNVTAAEVIYPAADLSEQISTAGTEASGTGNMKLALNGALTIGTLDGANVEIRRLVGPDNFFLFGLTEPEVAAVRHAGYRPRDYYESNPLLRRTLDALASGALTGGDTSVAGPVVGGLLTHDPYLLLADFQSYVDQQASVERCYRDADRWAHMSILNTARCGYFSSDRAVREYCDDVWGVSPVPVPDGRPLPVPTSEGPRRSTLTRGPVGGAHDG